MIIRTEKVQNYSVIDNTVFKDRELSWKAKGLLCYLLSLPNDWKINVEDLITRSTDGDKSTRTALNELISAGYITKETVRKKNGMIEGCNYVVREKPLKNECADTTESTPAETAETATTSPDAENGNPVKVGLLNTNIPNTNNSSSNIHSEYYSQSSSRRATVSQSGKVKAWVNSRVALAQSYRFNSEVSKLILQWFADLVEVGTLLPYNALQNQFDSLAKLSPQEQKSVLEETVTNGWRSLKYSMDNLKCPKGSRRTTYDQNNSDNSQFYSEEDKIRMRKEMEESDLSEF